jgi:tetratricopeptide (TPR) repeat protein
MDILEKNPEILGVAGEVARLAFSLGRFSDAADAVSFAVSKNDAGFSLLRLGGDACLYSDRIDEAVSYYTMALEAEPENVSASAALAHVQILRGEYREALPLLKRAASASAKPEYYYDKAVCEINLGKLDEAEETLLILTEVDSENQAALLLLADVYERKGEYDSMLETYARYLELNTENMEVFRKASAVYRMRGESEAALNGYEMILERNPNDKLTLRFKAEALFASGEFKEAAEVCALILEAGEDFGVRMLYAEALANAGDSEAAQKEYAAILKNNGDFAGAFLSYADLLSRNGDYARADTAYARVIQAAPKNERAYLERAANAVKTGNCEAILSALKESSAVNPKNPYVLAGTAYLYAVSGQPTEALSFFDKAESAGCRDLDLYCSRAFIYLSQSRFDMCDKAASEALKIRPSNRTALRLKARALEGLGRFEEAVSYYNLMLEEEVVEEDFPLPPIEEKKPEPKKTYSEDYYGERREKNSYRDMIIN